MDKVIILSILITLIFSTFGFSQNHYSDISLIYERHSEIIVKKNKPKFINYTPPYWIYSLSKKLIAPQLSLTDQYQLSLWNFTKSSFKTFGPIKGAFMSVDRINRTGRLGYIDFPSIRIISDNKIIDNPDFYKIK